MMRKNRFLIVLTNMDMGGITAAAVNFCNLLKEHGEQVDVLVMSDHQKEQENAFGDGVNVLHLKGAARLWNLGKPMIKREKNAFKKLLLSCLGVIKKLINKKSLWMRLVFRKKQFAAGYDAVIAYRQCAPCYYLALNCVDAKKRIAFVHGELKFMGDISTWQKYMYCFDSVAFVSDAVKNGFLEEYPSLAPKAVTVYNTFNVADIEKKAALECDTSFDKSVLNIITVARMDYVLKGVGRIPQVCKMLKESFNGRFHWYVVGGGPDLDKCINDAKAFCVSDHITFLGQQSNPYKYLSRADVCVLPSLTEAYPMVVGESLILGVPVVATRYPAVEEILVDSFNGLIAEQSVESLYEKLSLVLENKEVEHNLKKACESFVYDTKRSYDQFMKALRL